MVALGMVVCILTLILCNMSYYELFISTSKLHKIRNSKNLNDVTDHIRGVDDAAEEGGKHVFNWPTKKKKKNIVTPTPPCYIIAQMVPLNR